MARHRALLAVADVVFVDALKDGVMEARLFKQLETVKFVGAPIVVFDDIRFLSMLSFWRSITRPKLEGLTSFGRWTGTGLVEWCRSDLEARSTSWSTATSELTAACSDPEASKPYRPGSLSVGTSELTQGVASF